jgi:hypothetical protein
MDKITKSIINTKTMMENGEHVSIFKKSQKELLRNKLLEHNLKIKNNKIYTEFDDSFFDDIDIDNLEPITVKSSEISTKIEQSENKITNNANILNTTNKNTTNKNTTNKNTNIINKNTNKNINIINKNTNIINTIENEYEKIFNENKKTEKLELDNYDNYNKMQRNYSPKIINNSNLWNDDNINENNSPNSVMDNSSYHSENTSNYDESNENNSSFYYENSSINSLNVENDISMEIMDEDEQNIIEINKSKIELENIYNDLLQQKSKNIKYNWINDDTVLQKQNNNNILKQLEAKILMNVLIEATYGYNMEQNVYKIDLTKIMKYLKLLNLTQYKNCSCYIYYYEPEIISFCKIKRKITNEMYKTINKTKFTQLYENSNIFNKCLNFFESKENICDENNKIDIDNNNNNNNINIEIINENNVINEINESNEINIINKSEKKNINNNENDNENENIEHRFFKKQFENEGKIIDIYCVIEKNM